MKKSLPKDALGGDGDLALRRALKVDCLQLPARFAVEEALQQYSRGLCKACCQCGRYRTSVTEDYDSVFAHTYIIVGGCRSCDYNLFASRDEDGFLTQHREWSIDHNSTVEAVNLHEAVITNKDLLVKINEDAELEEIYTNELEIAELLVVNPHHGSFA